MRPHAFEECEQGEFCNCCHYVDGDERCGAPRFYPSVHQKEEGD